MEKVFKYYASACHDSHGNFLDDLGFKSTNKIEDADLIIFGGGADIEPETYGEEKGKHTSTSREREKIERRDFAIGMKLKKKFLGICRGHQFLTAMAGGKLIQDVTNHHGQHKIVTFDGNTLLTNSIHHQMVNPYALKDKGDFKILAWTSNRRSDHYLGARDKSVVLPWDFKEVESVYYPKIRALGFQYHPEMMHRDRKFDPVMHWTKTTFEKFFEEKL